MRLLNAPVPIIAAIAAQELAPPRVEGPAWVTAALAGAFLVLWFLDKAGRLPFSSSERRTGGYTDTDRAIAATVAAQLAAVHEIVVREDSEKPGWRMVWAPGKETREVRDTVQHLARLADLWAEDRERWDHERAKLEQRITQLEDVVRRQEHALQGRGG